MQYVYGPVFRLSIYGIYGHIASCDEAVASEPLSISKNTADLLGIGLILVQEG